MRGNPREKKSKQVSIEKYTEMMEYLYSLKRKKENKPFSALLRSLYFTSMEVILKVLKQRSHPFNCVAADKLISVTERGEVFPCELLDKPMGNLRDYNYDIKEIIKRSKLRGWIRKTKCTCTWECAVNASLIYDLRYYPKIIHRTMKILFK